jgi:hypothetical protein
LFAERQKRALLTVALEDNLVGDAVHADASILVSITSTLGKAILCPNCNILQHLLALYVQQHHWQIPKQGMSADASA